MTAESDVAGSIGPFSDRRRSWRRLLPPPRAVPITAVVLVVGFLVLAPLWYLLWGTFFGDNGFTLGGFVRAYGERRVLGMVANSLWFAVGTSLLSLVVGTVLAYLYVRTDAPFKGLLLAASAIPLIIPAILYVIAWVLLGSPQIGLFNKALDHVFGTGFVNVFNIWGMIWVEGLHVAPLVFLLMSAAFRSMDPSLEESALMAGASHVKVVFRVVLPLMRPAIVGAVVLMLVRSLESFEVPAVLGLQNNTYVFTSRIYYVLNSYPTDLAAAGALAVGLLVLSIAGVSLSSLSSRSSRRFQTVTGKAFRPRVTRLGRWRRPVGVGILLYFLVAVVAPSAVLVYASLLPHYQVPSANAFHSLTMANYDQLFQNGKAMTALKNSVFLGVAAATIVMLVMAFSAFVVVRSKLPGRQLIEHLSLVPLVIPGLVMGLAISFIFLRSPVPIYGTIWILLISYCTRYLPYGMRYSLTSMRQISSELEESASVSGATWMQTFRRVIRPLMMPGLVAGWTYILVVSFRELSSSILLYSPGKEVLAIVLFQEYENGEFPAVAALGVVMVLILTLLIVVGQKFGGRFGMREE